MRFMKRACMAVAAAAFVLAAAPLYNAQLNSNQATVNLNANMSESLSVTVAPGTVNFNLPASGIAPGSASVAINTSWVLSPARTSVSVYAFLGSAPAALTDGAGNNIASAKVSGSVNAGPMTPFTGPSPFSGATAITVVNALAITGANRNSNHADNVALQIDTTGLGLPSGIYTGIMTVQAQAI
jgi:hypothetical protein